MSKLTRHGANPDPALAEQDYEAIEAAVMETARGRWFLQEYARRNRNADTYQILGAVERLEHKIGSTPTASPANIPSVNPTEIRISLGEIQQAIDLTRHEIMSLVPPEGYAGPFQHSTGELDLVVDATEKATQDILARAESVQEVAWILREQHASPALCDQLDSNATEIYMACSFQDLTGQRIRKVIQALRFIEERVSVMMKVWMDGDHTPTHVHQTAPWLPNTQTLANGPASPGMGLDQDDVDAVLSTKTAHQQPAIQIEPAALQSSVIDDDPEDLIFEETPVEPAVQASKVKTSAPIAANTDISSLSVEEKLALFS